MTAVPDATDTQKLTAQVGIVAVTYSPGDTLEEFLDSLPAAISRPYEVVLADNGSTDGAPERAATRERVTLLRTGGNLGYGGGANAGAAALDSDWLVIANPDLLWRPGSLDALLAAADRWPTGGAFGPGTRTADGTLYPSARELPSIGRGIGHAAFGWWWPSNPWTRSYRRERGPAGEGPTGWLSGGCLLLRGEAFDAVGGFDPGYFMYFEDVDLCERLAKAGWQSIYVPGAIVVHESGQATASVRPAMVREHHRSAYRYLAKKYAGVRYAPLRMVLKAGLSARATLSRAVPMMRAGARLNRKR